MYRISFHLVSIVLGLGLAANLPIIHQPSNSTLANKLERRARVMSRAGVILCRDFPGLSREQSSTCLRHPLETAVALQGLKLAVAECQYQFRWNRWNCSSLRGLKNRNPHSATLLKKGYRESAFAFAISSAGVMHTIIRACGLGILPNCGCEKKEIIDVRTLPEEQYRSDPEHGVNLEDNETPRQKLRRQTRSSWKWGGCAHNLRFGMQFSKLFLDSRENRGADLQSKVNLHNNNAGRVAVMANAKRHCKCHGLSGSCEVQTCWRSVPEFRKVGDTLKSQFWTAILVGQGNLGQRGESDELEEVEETDNSVQEIVPESLQLNTDIETNGRRDRKTRKRRGYFWRSSRKEPDVADLLYFQKSPNFCESSPDFPGTTSRRCHKNSAGNDGCASMCCGRGYNLIRLRITEKCLCRFEWCCQVMCKNCTVEEWVTVCK
ncbi:protein Wnt-10b-like [Neocloeon triangulifer]|uniref:protein Wnt-10b-like n=1 Tax=Neocloeon triangulifer TaxID=2078957 RepID=UPI00286F3C11|nr:protein Wnt-10b-like [Neocloeon triangulifer]